MNVLGFDTSTSAASVCVLRTDGQAFEFIPRVERLSEPPGHARELMPAVDRLMREAGLGFGDLDALGVGIGPGGFTGLRIGIATAHGIAQSAEVPLHPVLSLAALAAGIESDAPFPVIDARRNEVYGLDRAGEPFVGSIDDAVGEAPRGALAAGDGSIRFRESLESAEIRVAPGDSGMHVVRGLYICRLAATVQPVPPESVVPCYLRAPDAKPPSRSAG
ncbi:MAG TPA: tRNA (adenosine(37)-N6)-threonylcarbamoyltransferase complex dimerization subunit type 1 TsaB [Thermoleophilaceae bacterium]|jgi:tRNA threonylcarbamoyladenosine biosynthesis protein TsaB|nr:tRNA (adenosine(37)-N6)-threonylcarbamoyltransferase complex dimerization subunit type 1 TsaB [Thermoleophilaceae bacterium]